jgi:hypothetical protein
MAEDAVVEVKAAPEAKVAKAKVASLLSSLCYLLSTLCSLPSAHCSLSMSLSVVFLSIADETKLDWRPTVRQPSDFSLNALCCQE